MMDNLELYKAILKLGARSSRPIQTGASEWEYELDMSDVDLST